MWFIFGFDLEREVMGVDMNIYLELSMIWEGNLISNYNASSKFHIICTPIGTSIHIARF